MVLLRGDGFPRVDGAPDVRHDLPLHAARDVHISAIGDLVAGQAFSPGQRILCVVVAQVRVVDLPEVAAVNVLPAAPVQKDNAFAGGGMPPRWCGRLPCKEPEKPPVAGSGCSDR